MRHTFLINPSLAELFVSILKRNFQLQMTKKYVYLLRTDIPLSESGHN